MADGHGAELRIALTRVRRRWLAARWLHGLARVAGGVCVGLLAVIGTELLLAPPDVPLLATAAAALAAALAFSAFVLWRLGRPPSDERVARLVEERCPELEDRVASAAVLAAARPATGFEELVVADAAERLRRIDVARVVTPARLRRAVTRGLLALAALVAVVSLGSTPLGRIARTAWLHASPAVAELAVEPGDFRLVAGQPLRVRARFEDGGGTAARTPPVLSVLDGMAPRDVRMRPSGDGYVAEFPSVTRSFRYRVGAAAFTSPDYFVEALSPPRVMRIDVEYVYPSFTGLAPRSEEGGGDLFAPAGTAARLVVHTDKPVVDGALVLSDGRRVALAGAGDARRAATLVVEGDGRYRVRVVDAHGLSNRDTADYLIRATADRPPAVRMLRPGGDREVTPLEEVTIEVRADDDHAVERVDLVYTVVGRPERTLPFDIPEGVSAVTGVRTFFVEDLAVEPGDVVTYFARARDAGLGGVSTEARSDLYFLEIRPFDNEFEEALSQGGLGPQAAEIGRLVALQKQIVVATWRLDQEAEGRSDDDVRAVAEVQGDVRDTAAGTMGAMGRGPGRRGRGAAGDDGPAGQGRAMRAAVEAMTAAEAALEALDTSSAIPHETEALNQLLTAQAAVRRRQVSMQPGAGSGGQQAQLDLSQLFDRELRREQETSYETGRQPGEQEGGEEDEALARLRELARRQERINRDLGRTAETETEAERRRMLERLRREQQELRAELEALAQRLGGRPGAGSDGSRGAAGEELRRASDGSRGAAGEELRRASEGSAGTAGEELRRASEEMQRAGSGLGRQDAETARGHGDRAADALRRLAERLRGASPGEGTGAPGSREDEAEQRLAAELETARRLLDRLRASAADDAGRAVDAGEPSGDRPSAGESSGDRPSAGELSGDRPSGGELSPDSGLGNEAGAAGEPPDGDGDASGRHDADASEQSGPGAGGSPGAGQEAAAELAQRPELLRALGEANPGLVADLERWARQWRSRSAPGTDPARLDLAHWTVLRRDLITALQRFERDRARELSDRALRDRYAGEAGDTVPERYRRLVEQYYRSLADPRAVP